MSSNKSFGKLYAKTFTGSLYGCGPVRLAVWAYAIANALPPEGTVQLNPKMLAGVVGTDEPQISEAIAYLSAPDAQSRNPADEGRRLRHVSGFEYRLVNFVAHRSGVDEDARREYWRERQRAHREVVKRSVNDSPGQSHKQKQKQKQKTIVLNNVGKNAADAAPASNVSDEAWIESLKSNPAYAGIDVSREHAKMAQWCAVNRKQPTRRRFVNWLNRADKPMSGKAPGVDRPGSNRNSGTLHEGSADDYANVGKV